MTLSSEEDGASVDSTMPREGKFQQSSAVKK